MSRYVEHIVEVDKSSIDDELSGFIDITVEIDLDDFIDEYWDEEIAEEAEKRGLTIIEDFYEDSRRVPNQTLHEELCDQFEISRFSSKSELLNKINSLL